MVLKLIDDAPFIQYTGTGDGDVFQFMLTKKNIEWQYRQSIIALWGTAAKVAFCFNMIFMLQPLKKNIFYVILLSSLKWKEPLTLGFFKSDFSLFVPSGGTAGLQFLEKHYI